MSHNRNSPSCSAGMTFTPIFLLQCLACISLRGPEREKKSTSQKGFLCQKGEIIMTPLRLTSRDKPRETKRKAAAALPLHSIRITGYISYPRGALCPVHLQSQHRQCPFHEPSVCSATTACSWELLWSPQDKAAAPSPSQIMAR